MTLAVVYDHGAASAGDIAVGLAEVAPVVFVLPPSRHNEQLRDVLRGLGDVAVLRGDPVADAAAVRGHRPLGIVTFSESMLVTTAALADALGLPFHSPSTVRLLTDKLAQRDRLRSGGVDDVKGHLVRSVAEWPDAVRHVGLPAVLKPLRGQGSRHTYPVTDEEEGRRLLEGLLPGDPMLLEELLLGRAAPPFGDYVSVESACGPGGVRHLAVTGKFPLAHPFREVGKFWPARVTPAQRAEILALTTRALRALGVSTGITHTEIKLTPEGPRIIEVNGRLGGHINDMAKQSCGVDLVRLAGRLALGQAVPVPPLEPGGVHFQYHTLAPVEPCRLMGSSGGKEVRRIPGISGYRTYAKKGEELPGGVRTHFIDVLWGASGTHQAMVDILGSALPRITHDVLIGGLHHRVSPAL
ncbi:acetyl-CoA carboxylase biotin carboxylase subunit family protein [Streptomyces sp. NPDC058195]|uniref:ATP-grasp domain-containing protein n=1 Tax=Streptomyces sp. NPDC058195 TaxID=3346375 RepID=UPI0036EB3E30